MVENFVEEKKRIEDLSKQIYKECETAQVPMFLAYCTKEKGYQYRCLLPGEFLGKYELGENPDRFKKFLAVVRDFDKEEYRTNIQK